MSDGERCQDCGETLTADNVWEPGTCQSCAKRLTPADLHAMGPAFKPCADPTHARCGPTHLDGGTFRLQRPEGCLDAFVEALMGDPWIGTLVRNSPIQFGADSMRRTVEYALERAGVILAMRR